MLLKKCSLVFGAVIIMFSSMFLVGCTNENKNSERTITKVSNEIDTLSLNKYKQYKHVIKEFNLGRKRFSEQVDIDIKGLISAPKNRKNAPILIILAGNENIVKDGPSSRDLYRGYKYLAESLAESGFLTLVIDTQFKDTQFDDDSIVEDKILGELYDYHIENLKNSIEGKSSIYGLSLNKVGDINNIGLIGQSSTAKSIFNICSKKYESKDKSIKALLSITPGESLITTTAYPDVPTAILVAEHSLNTKTGFDIYNEIENSIDRKNVALLTYLIGGNSKKFNEKIKEEKILEAKVNEVVNSEQDDESSSNTEDTIVSSKSVSTSDNIISEEKIAMSENVDIINDTSLHESFLSTYCISYFKSMFNEDEEFKNILFGNSVSPTKMYGLNVLNKYYNSEKEDIYSSSWTKGARFKRSSVVDVIESSMSEVDTAVNLNEPTATIEMKLKQVNWEKKRSSMSINLKNVDLSKYSAFNIRWVLNSFSSLNTSSYQSVVLTLEDSHGKASSIVLDSENALRKIEGREKIDENGYSQWSRYTPLSDTRVPFKAFKDVNLKELNKFTISFGNSESGSIYIDDVSLIG